MLSHRVPVSCHCTPSEMLKEKSFTLILFWFFFSTSSHSYLWRYKRRNRQHERRRLRDTRDEAGSQSGTEWVSSSPPKAQWINLQYALRESSRQNPLILCQYQHTLAHIIEVIEPCIKMYLVFHIIYFCFHSCIWPSPKTQTWSRSTQQQNPR